MANFVSFAAVKLMLANIFMEDMVQVGQKHKVNISLYRDQSQQNRLWQSDQCFVLTFDSPYGQGPNGESLWDPFDPAEKPVCEVRKSLNCGKTSNLSCVQISI